MEDSRITPIAVVDAHGRKRRRWIRRTVIFSGVLLAVFCVLFVVNGTLCSYGERPLLEVLTPAPTSSPIAAESPTIKILAYNIAKCFAYSEETSFGDVADVKARIEKMISLINREEPDFVFLSEVFLECDPCPTNQAREIAKGTGMHAWAFGENFNFGLPFYRMRSGNALLSRSPIEAVGNPSLVGRKPFFITKNNRRVLWCATEIQGERVLLASIHNDTFDKENNARQMQQILDFAGDRPAILAGDFNAHPDWPALELIRKSGRFSGEIKGELTYPTEKPERRLDYIFAPSDWELMEHRVIPYDASDHLPIVSVYRLPQNK